MVIWFSHEFHYNVFAVKLRDLARLGIYIKATLRLNESDGIGSQICGIFMMIF